MVNQHAKWLEKCNELPWRMKVSSSTSWSPDWIVKPIPPFIPGHEGVGIIAAVGPGVTRFKEGDPAGVAWLYDACGWCEYCRTGWDALCCHQRNTGFNVNGSFAEYVIGSAPYVGRLPNDPSFAAMAPILCAGVTTYKGIKETEAKPGEWILISGVGGLGQLAIEYAKAMGLHVAAVDVSEKKLELARASGAEVTVNAKLSDAPAQVVRQTGGGSAWRTGNGPVDSGFPPSDPYGAAQGHGSSCRPAAGRIPNPHFRGCSRPHHDTRIDCGRPPGPRGSDRVRRRREGPFPLPRDEARRHQPGVQRHESRETRWPDGHDVFLKVVAQPASPQRRGRQGGTKINVKSARVDMNVLVFNAGSSSLKFGLFQCAGTPRPIVVGAARDIDKRRSWLLAHDDNGSVIFEDAGAEDLEGASRQIIAKLQEGGYPTPDVVGHRIVHGGPEVLDHCLIDDSVMRKLEDATAFAPLHGRPALSIVKIAQAAYTAHRIAQSPQGDLCHEAPALPVAQPSHSSATGSIDN